MKLIGLLWLPLPPEVDEPLLELVEEYIEAVADPVELLPVVEVEFVETKMPPAMLGGEVLTSVLAAASLYASSVLGDGGALVQRSALCPES